MLPKTNVFVVKEEKVGIQIVLYTKEEIIFGGQKKQYLK